MADRHNRDIDRPRAPLPEPLPVPTVDAHAHMEIVTDAAFDSQEVADVIAEAKSVNVDRIVQVGYSAEQSKWCVAALLGAMVVKILIGTAPVILMHMLEPNRFISLIAQS